MRLSPMRSRFSPETRATRAGGGRWPSRWPRSQPNAMVDKTGTPLSGDGLYWDSADADEVMQDEHGFIWRAMLETIDLGLSGKLVLDSGCNRGGFLRLLCKECGISAGFGYDPAPGAIADARRLAGSCPLTFEVADTVPPGWERFDVAFSHEVLYLIDDL